MNKSISIIIPVFNEADTILQLLNKVNKQVNKEIEKEVIVINDGSTDETHKLINDNFNLQSIHKCILELFDV